VHSGVDTVFHQAALRITHCAAEPREALEVMVDATFNLLEECVRASVRKVVFASSASVYGTADEFPTTERQNPYDNRTLYGAAKAFGEGMLRSFNDMYGLDYVALRYFNVYGPGMDVHGKYTEVLIRWMERIARGEPPLIFGDGLQTMDFIHVADVARANLLAAASPATDMVFNIGSGIETSLLELARHLAKVMGREDLVPVHVATIRSIRFGAGWRALARQRRVWASRRRFRCKPGFAILSAGGAINRPAHGLRRQPYDPDREALARAARSRCRVQGGAFRLDIPRRRGGALRGRVRRTGRAPYACAVSNCTTALHLPC